MEVIEAIEVLSGEGPDDLKEVSFELAANMLYLADKGTIKECRRKVEEVVENKAARDKFARMIEAQGGDSRFAYHTELFQPVSYTHLDVYKRQKCVRVIKAVKAARDRKEEYPLSP